VAVHSTVLDPTGKTLPDGGLQTTCGNGSVSSIAYELEHDGLLPSVAVQSSRRL
jgi:hypothetical protein